MIMSFALAAFAAAQAIAPGEPLTAVSTTPAVQSSTVQAAPAAPPAAPAQTVQIPQAMLQASPAPIAPPTLPTPYQAPAYATAGMQAPLTLTCGGAGTAEKQRGSFIFGSHGGFASVVSHHDRQFNDQIDVRLFSGDDRIRLPRTMLPGIHGGHDGWFKLKDVVADARAIHASAAVSAFHNPKVYIDRTTGTISISGKDGDYSGQCEVIDANAGPKF